MPNRFIEIFTSRLSAAISETNPGDMAALLRPRRQGLCGKGIENVSDEVVSGAVTKAEYRLHC